MYFLHIFIRRNAFPIDTKIMRKRSTDYPLSERDFLDDTGAISPIRRLAKPARLWLWLVPVIPIMAVRNLKGRNSEGSF